MNQLPELAVEVDHLAKTYGDRSVLREVTFEVAGGSRTVLLGPNGAGKSTTLEIIATLRRPGGGHVRVHGHDVVTDTTAVRRMLGLTPQREGLDPLMTPLETLVFHAVALGLTRRAAHRRATELLELLRLDGNSGTRLAKLSGGTRRRVDLAMALLGHPSVIILDEPTTGLDPLTRLDLWTELRRLNETDGVTLLISTQDLHEADVLATGLIVLRDGEVVADGTPAQLKQQVDRSAVTGLRLEEPTLDDVFATLATTPERTR